MKREDLNADILGQVTTAIDSDDSAEVCKVMRTILDITRAEFALEDNIEGLEFVAVAESAMNESAKGTFPSVHIFETFSVIGEHAKDLGEAEIASACEVLYAKYGEMPYESWPCCVRNCETVAPGKHARKVDDAKIVVIASDVYDRFDTIQCQPMFSIAAA